MIVMATTSQMLHDSLALLFKELIDGPPTGGAYMLNPTDPGLLRSLDRLPAEAASAVSSSGASIAAHIDHVRYGLELMNRWSAGVPDPWTGADWKASWQRTAVTGEQWSALRQELRRESERWRAALQAPREMSALELHGVIASIAHLAYHLGAIRQIDRSIQGPRAT
jgi:hypothetical protein